MQYIQYDPTNTFYKSIVGAVEENQKFGIRLQLNQCVAPTNVYIVVYGDDGVFNQEYAMYREVGSGGWDSYLCDISLTKGLYWYYFRMEGVKYEHFIGIDSNNKPSLYYDNVNPWQLSVYKKLYNVPDWLNKGVMYQIMPDRFYGDGTTVASEDKILRPWGEQPFFADENGVVRNHDFFGGNLNGIRQKLPYLASLNVKTIYLNPIFKAYSNHKYDTEDYEVIDPMFGTYEDFVALCKEAKKLGIRIILDGVFNHVGSSSKYFNRDKKYGDGGAYNDKNSPYREWFNFDQNNNYECWWNFQTLPRINANSKSAQDYFCGKGGIVEKWLKAGASGWRLDVVDEIADCMLDKIVATAKKAKPDCAIIGEVWEDASNKMDYGVRRHYFDGSQLDTVMNYPLMKAIVDFVRYGNEKHLSHVVFNLLNNYPTHVRNNLMNILGTHDTMRIITQLAGERLDDASKETMARTKLTDKQYKEGCKLLKIATILQYTMFGFPCVFYGDEVTMEGYRDPFCRGCYPWDKQNKLMLDFFKRMGDLRNMTVFCEGDFHQLVAENGVYAFERISAKTQTQAIVGVNRGKQEYNLYLAGSYEDVFTGRRYHEWCHLQPNGYVILKRVY